MANSNTTSDAIAPDTRRRALYSPSAAQMADCQLTGFIRYLEQESSRSFASYTEFETFCLEAPSAFWNAFLVWSAVIAEGDTAPAFTGQSCEEAVFFPGLRLNYTENLLRLSDETHAAQNSAIVAVHADGSVDHWTRGELRERTESLARALAQIGVVSSERVALVAYNTPEAVSAALAAAAIGCTVSTLAPELGPTAMLARMQQIEPVVLMTDFSAAAGVTGEQQRARLAEVAAALPSLRAVIVLDETSPLPELAIRVCRARDICAEHAAASLPQWPRLPFNHPLFVMFSSGTTGVPKCIVHGAGGTLLEHLKEHRLHCDLRPQDRLYFQTATGWMMWNWQLSALAAGTSIVLYDGPIQAADTLWRIVASQDVSVFGTSPGYLQLCERAAEGVTGGLDFARLRGIMSTGSILSPRQQDWVSQHVKALPVQSISGGTDIIGCFVLGNPLLPAYSAEPQCRSIGLDVRAVNQDGSPATGIGELVCANPFPSRPVGFLNDPDGSRFHAAYFSQHPGLWMHGDLVEITPEGSVRMHGRSDGVLNVRGIRIGPAEIYRILERIPQVAEAMAVEQDSPDEIGGSRLVLLVVLKHGCVLDDALRASIRRELAQQGSPAHVPSVLLAVPELPTTWSGKASERSARDVLNAREAVNAEALRNPASLEPLRAFLQSGSEKPATAAPAIASGQGTGTLGMDEMRALWVDVLQQTGLSPEDNFFDVGGNSLAALSLVEAVSSRVGHSVPMTAILETPTMEAFTALVNSRVVPKTSLLVTLKEGGTGAPLYIVHGYGGSVIELRQLAQSIQTENRIVGIRASGFEADEPVYERIEDMAQAYLAAIRKEQPHGPYRIGGYSMGGLVAHEMARRLASEGEHIELLLLIDTVPHQSRWSGSAWREFVLRRSLRHLRILFGSSGRARRLLQLARSLRDHVRLAVSAAPPADELADLTLPDFVHDLRRVGLQAYAQYAPSYGAVPIVLIRSDMRLSALADPAVIWRKLSPGLVVHQTPGDHLSMIVPPNLLALAGTLSAILQKTGA